MLASLLAIQNSAAEHAPITGSSSCCNAFLPRKTRLSPNLPFGRSPASKLNDRRTVGLQLYFWRSRAEVYSDRRCSGIIRTSSESRKRVWRAAINRRKFIAGTGVVGAGLIGVGGARLVARGYKESHLKFTIGGKTSGIHSAPAAVPIRRSGTLH